jgi:hypothetical protein
VPDTAPTSFVIVDLATPRRTARREREHDAVQDRLAAVPVRHREVAESQQADEELSSESERSIR